MTREELRRILELNREIRKGVERAAMFRSIATSTGSQDFGDRVQTSVENRSNSMLIEALDLEEIISELARERDNLQQEAAKAFDRLEDMDQRTVMRLRYLQCASWMEISKVMFVSGRHAKRIHARAMAQVAE